MFGWGKRKREPEPGTQDHGGSLVKFDFSSGRMPTVKFDPARLTETVKGHIRQDILSLTEIGPSDCDAVYNAAIIAMSVGGNLPPLYQALLAVQGMSKQRAKEITHSLSRKAHSRMSIEGFERLGINRATWLYSGAPCAINPKKPTDKELQRDKAHKGADGKVFTVSKGLFLNSEWTFPGYEDGCKCSAVPVIPEFGLGKP